jgi:hypothetical protein
VRFEQGWPVAFGGYNCGCPNPPYEWDDKGKFAHRTMLKWRTHEIEDGPMVAFDEERE